MGYLLKEALKTLCGVNQWSYAVFWKIGCQNPKLLIWEECYHEPVVYPGLAGISGWGSEDWDAGEMLAKARNSHIGAHTANNILLLVNRMMTENQICIVGEGLVGRAAFSGNHQWILSDSFIREAHPPEVLKELYQQFSCGIKTVAVVPVLPHGVVQLGSCLPIVENLGFLNDVKTLVLQLGCVPGTLLSDNNPTKEPPLKVGLPVCMGNSFSLDSSWRTQMTDSTIIVDSLNYQSRPSPTMGFMGQTSCSLAEIQNSLQSSGLTFQPPASQSFAKLYDNQRQGKTVPSEKWSVTSTSQLRNGETKTEMIPANPEIWLNQQSSLYIPRSIGGQEPSLERLTVNDINFSKEQQALPKVSVPSHTNDNLNLFVSRFRSNECFNSFSIENSVARSVDSSGLCNDVGGQLNSFSSLDFVRDANKLSNNSIHGAGKICDSTKLEVSLSTSYLTTSPLLSCISVNGQYCEDNKSVGELGYREKLENDLFQALGIPLTQQEEHVDLNNNDNHDSRKHDYGAENLEVRNAKYEDACSTFGSGADLFDVLGADFRNSLFSGSCNNLLGIGPNSNTKVSGSQSLASPRSQEAASSVDLGSSANGVFCASDFDNNLLEAIVSNPPAKQGLDDNVSCRTTLTNMSSSAVPNASCSYGRTGVPDQVNPDVFGFPEALVKEEALSSCSFRSSSSKDSVGAYSLGSSIYGSKVNSFGQGHNLKLKGSASSGYSKRPEEASKTNRKRLKPGENPRPRPKDRQMIQDRVKELREIVPNGAKCSIDALLERTIKHMLFLQSVMKHADKLKQTGESKIISKEGGLLIKDNFEGGATWAYEIGSQSMVCPIIVEDLNQPRQMLVEMLCEERGLFLEIADIIRGLGLTILKGVMETRNDKIWARFAVEANRDVTRMQIFISLVRLLEQSMKSGAAAANMTTMENTAAHQANQDV